MCDKEGEKNMFTITTVTFAKIIMFKGTSIRWNKN